MNSSTAAVEQADPQLQLDRLYAFTVAVAAAQQLISILGILFNWALVYVTLRRKALRKIHGYLLAICCLCNALTEFGTPLATVLTSLRMRIPLLTCCFAQCLASMGSICSYWNLFYASLDRVVAVAFPNFYRRNFTKQTGKYAVCMNLGSLLAVAYNLYLAFAYAAQHPEIRVYCAPGDMFQGEALKFGSHMMLTVTGLTVLVYAGIGVALKVLKNETNENDSRKAQRDITRRIFKSLIMIATVVFVCCFIAKIGVLLVPMAVDDIGLQFLCTRLINQLITFAGLVNAPVLYVCSTEYRSMMQKEFALVNWLSRLRLTYQHYYQAQQLQHPMINMAAAYSTAPPPQIVRRQNYAANATNARPNRQDSTEM